MSFLREGTPKGAAVMGTLMGFVAVVWAVLLGRFGILGGPRGTPGARIRRDRRREPCLRMGWTGGDFWP